MTTPVRHVPDAERRARLGVRHALAPSARAADAEAATRAVTVLHSTEPATVHLSLWARVPGITTADVERALHDDRTLVKQLAMRRTLFVFPRDLLPAAWGSASARVARIERDRMAKDVVAAGVTDDGHAWVDRAGAEVLALLEHHPEGLTATEIRTAVPMLDRKIEVAGGAIWSAPRILTHLGLTAELVRAVNTGHWRVSRPRWAPMRDWLGDVPAALDVEAGYAELVRRWLHAFGPGTEDDVVWWLGATKGAVRTALADLDAVPVSLDGGGTGWLLPDDVAEVAPPEPWAALLPVLDPTVMGWKQRDFYLAADGQRPSLAPQLFDRNGNAGTTAWVDGRVVGCWTQDEDAVVRVHLLADVPARGRRALDAEAERLTDWLDGVKVGTVYPSPAMKEHRS